MAGPALVARAADNLRRELDLAAAPVAPEGAAGEEVVLPLVGDRAVYGYRIATRLTIDGGADGRYLAYVDPATGEVLAVRQQNFYAAGTLLYRGVDRYPRAAASAGSRGAPTSRSAGRRRPRRATAW